MDGPNRYIVMRETGRDANNRIEAQRRERERVARESARLQSLIAEARQNEAMTNAEIYELLDIKSTLQRDLDSALVELEGKEAELNVIRDARDLSGVTNNISNVTTAIETISDRILIINEEMQNWDEYREDLIQNEFAFFTNFSFKYAAM